MQLFGPHRAKPPKRSGIQGGNTGWLHVEYRGWPYVFIIARQDIAAGAELTIDYGEGYAACASSFTAARFCALCCGVCVQLYCMIPFAFIVPFQILAELGARPTRLWHNGQGSRGGKRNACWSWLR
jgi:hypothetical protein